MEFEKFVKNKQYKKLAKYLKTLPIEELPKILNGYYVSVFRSAYKEFGNLSQNQSFEDVCDIIAFQIVKMKYMVNLLIKHLLKKLNV